MSPDDHTEAIWYMKSKNLQLAQAMASCTIAQVTGQSDCNITQMSHEQQECARLALNNIEEMML